MTLEVNIKNHSDGNVAGVTSANQLKVQASTLSLQHYTSHIEETAFQVRGEGNIAAGTATMMYFKNTHSTRDTALTYIRAQIVDSAATMPSVNTYLQIGLGDSYTSGGSAITAINMNTNSGKTASIDAYDSAPTMAGTFTEIDRYHFTGDGDAVSYNKEASIIIGPGKTFSIRIVSDNASGIVQCRLSFLMLGEES